MDTCGGDAMSQLLPAPPNSGTWLAVAAEGEVVWMDRFPLNLPHLPELVFNRLETFGPTKREIIREYAKVAQAIYAIEVVTFEGCPEIAKNCFDLAEAMYTEEEKRYGGGEVSTTKELA